MPSSRSEKPLEPDPTARAARDVPADEMGFGGEPTEIVAPQLTWGAADEPTQITKTPPIVPPHIEPMRPSDLGRTLVGQRLEHFVLDEMVGGGGMGAVFRALDTRLNRTVAIKVLPRDQAADEEVVRRFRNEAQSAARLDHDHVARVYYVGEHQGLHFIAFEFIEGKNLRDVVAERGPLPVADALNFTLQIADALAHAAARDVVHRDIKPSNVLITNDGRAKLVDMGLARLHHLEKSSDDLTASGVTLGTFDYISPEQARDPRSADARSDIYSLGCTLFFMLTGRPPFPDGTVLQKLLQHQADEAPDPREFNSSVPPELVRLLRRMMAKDPRQRPQSPDELVGELALLANQWGIRPSTGDGLLIAAQRGEPTFVERHIVWIAPVAVLLLIFAVLRLSGRNDGRLTGPVLPNSTAPSPAVSRTTVPETAGGVRNRESAPPNNPPRAVIRSNDNSDADLPETRLRPSPYEDTELTDDALVGSNPIGDVVGRTSTTRLRPEPADFFDLSNKLSGAASTAGQDATYGASSADGLEFSAVRASASESSVEPVPSAPDAGAALAIPEGVLVVSPGRSGPGVFPTLRAACAAAQPDDVVELRYQGRLEEQPLDLTNKRLTLRAGQGFQPIVVFRPRITDPQRQVRNMIALTGGRLTMVNLAVELDLPTEMPADGWSLVRLQQAENLQLEDCSLTLRNAARPAGAFHEDVAFLRIVGPPGGNPMVAPESASEPLSIQIRDCVARGEANFLVQEDAQPCQFSWSNGLVSISGYLIVSEGGRRVPTNGAKLRLDLTHVTADAREGLCRLSNTVDLPYQAYSEIRVSNSILRGSEGRPMIVQSGIDTVSELRGRFKWEGNRNFYDGYKTFWRIQGRDRNDEPQLAELPGWMSFLRGEKTWGRVVWRGLPADNRPPHSLEPTDYALDNLAANNAAVKGASDGRDAGCDFKSLPPVPVTPDRFSMSNTITARDSDLWAYLSRPVW